MCSKIKKVKANNSAATTHFFVESYGQDIFKTKAPVGAGTMKNPLTDE